MSALTRAAACPTTHPMALERWLWALALCVLSVAAHVDSVAKPPRSSTRGRAVGLKVVTWNVLATPTAASRRIPVLLRILEESSADLIALQEVSPWFLKRLWAQKWVQEGGYQGIVDAQRRPSAPGGLYVLSRRSLKDISFHRLAPTIRSAP